MLIGDIIIGARERMLDLPRGLNLPAGVAITAAVVAAGGSTLPTGTYVVKGTFTNPWGETLATAELGALVVAANQGIQVTAPLISAVPGATGIRVYFGNNGAGSENQFLPTAALPFTISTPGNPGIPPTRNTSFYPDIDGQRISAWTIYRWFNEALEAAAAVCEGIPDMSGLPTIAGQAMYETAGIWNKVDHLWWDGYGLESAGRDSLFYRNVVPGTVRTAVVQISSDRLVIELQPQPNRGGGVTTLNGPVLATDKTIVLTDVSGFKLPFGMLQIGTPPLVEVISFSAISGATLTGIIRGMGGTTPLAWATLTPAAEANLRFAGLRVFSGAAYVPGQGAQNLPVPNGWRTPLIDFILSQFKQTTGNSQDAQRLLQNFTQTLKETAKGNKVTIGPRQVGGPGGAGYDTYPSAGLGGRIIVP